MQRNFYTPQSLNYDAGSEIQCFTVYIPRNHPHTLLSYGLFDNFKIGFKLKTPIPHQTIFIFTLQSWSNPRHWSMGRGGTEAHPAQT